MIESGQPIYLPRYADWEDYLLLLQSPPVPIQSFNTSAEASTSLTVANHCFEDGDRAVVLFSGVCATLQIAAGSVLAASPTALSIDAPLTRPQSGCIAKPINLQGFFLEGWVELLPSLGLGQCVAGTRKILVQGGDWNIGDRIDFPAAGVTGAEILNVFTIPSAGLPMIVLIIDTIIDITLLEGALAEVTKQRRFVPIDFRSFNPTDGEPSDQSGLVQASIPAGLLATLPGSDSCGQTSRIGCYSIVIRRGYVNPDPTRYKNQDGSPMTFYNWSRIVAEGPVFSYGLKPPSVALLDDD